MYIIQKGLIRSFFKRFSGLKRLNSIIDLTLFQNFNLIELIDEKL